MNLLLNRNDLKTIWETFVWAISIRPFDPERDGIPGPRQAQPETVKPQPKPQVKLDSGYKLAATAQLDNGEVKTAFSSKAVCVETTFTWDVSNKQAQKRSDKVEYLTQRDKEELKKRKVAESTAAKMKVVFAKNPGVTSTELAHAAGTSMQVGKNALAAFNAALLLE